MLPTSDRSATAYVDLRRRLTDVLAEVPDDVAAATPVPACPGWSVTDLAAHVYGVPRDVLDGNVTDAGSSAWTSAQVGRFAPRGLAHLVAGWNEEAPPFEEMLAGFPDGIAARIAFDTGAHEHDLRGALGQPGGRDAATVLIGLEFMGEGIAAHIAHRSLPGVEYVTPGYAATLGEGPRRVRVATDTFTLYRTVTGRRSAAQVRALPWEGDPFPYLEAFVGSPIALPDVDIVE